jgi:hypothetical protein
MTSELISQLNDLLERWDTLSAAAVEKMEMAQRPEQGGFYAGVLFGMDVARDELAAALAQALVETAKPLSDVMNSAGLPPN